MSGVGSSQALIAISRAWHDATRTHSAGSRNIVAVTAVCALAGLGLGHIFDADWPGLVLGLLAACIGVNGWLLVHMARDSDPASLESDDVADS